MPEGARNLSLADFVAPRKQGRRLRRCLRRHGRPSGCIRPGGVRARPRRLSRHHGQGARRSPRRSVRRIPSRARSPRLGLRRRRALTSEDLIAERYRGIRPAFGYPACPDHTEKRKLFDLLQAGRAGITLTDSFAMAPAASVSGLYLAHPAGGTSRSVASDAIRSRNARYERRASSTSSAGSRQICRMNLSLSEPPRGRWNNRIRSAMLRLRS